LQIVYGEPRTGSHFLARHIANKNNMLFLGEYFKTPIPNAQVNIEDKIKSIPENSVIIIHPDLSYGYYTDTFYDWLFSNPLIVTETNDRWRQVISWGIAAKTTNYHSFNISKQLDQYIIYKREFFDMLKYSIQKFESTKHLINYKERYTLQDLDKISFVNGKYNPTKKTYKQNTQQLSLMYENIEEVKEWYQEIRINKN
jgi:hypothetical protein